MPTSSPAHLTSTRWATPLQRLVCSLASCILTSRRTGRRACRPRWLRPRLLLSRASSPCSPVHSLRHLPHHLAHSRQHLHLPPQDRLLSLSPLWRPRWSTVRFGRGRGGLTSCHAVCGDGYTVFRRRGAALAAATDGSSNTAHHSSPTTHPSVVCCLACTSSSSCCARSRGCCASSVCSGPVCRLIRRVGPGRRRRGR